MATTTRPELSKKNEYYLPKHRYYELKHFCLQYKFWERELRAIDFMSTHRNTNDIVVQMNNVIDPTADIAERRMYYRQRINMVRVAAIQADDIYWEFLLKHVTENLSYETLKTTYDMKCPKDRYYESYRKFFWLLDKKRK